MKLENTSHVLYLPLVNKSITYPCNASHLTREKQSTHEESNCFVELIKLKSQMYARQPHNLIKWRNAKYNKYVLYCLPY